MKNISKKILITLMVISMALMSLVGCGADTNTGTNTGSETSTDKDVNDDGTRTITDMVGREVELPKQIESIVTIGSVPVINGMVFAMGQGDKIESGLPAFAQKEAHKYQTVLHPSIKDKPVIQGADVTSIDVEELAKISPDIIFTMHEQHANDLQDLGFNVFVLNWKKAEDAKEVVSLMGEIFNEQDRAKEYVEYFDETLKRVSDITSKIPEEEKVRVIYASLQKMTQPHLIAEWWIDSAGGKSVTAHNTTLETLDFSMEDFLEWNPEVIITSNADDLELAYKDKRFEDIEAVKNKRVYMSPTMAHSWVNRSIEQPLTVMWTGKLLYPEQFKDIDMEKELKDFSSKFFDYELSDEEAKDVLENTRLNLPQY